MTSQINHETINENFPIPGEDNDTQTFRDNFDSIKNNFRYAKEEITDLQDNVVRIDQDNDLNRNKITNASFLANRELMLDGGIPPGDVINIDFENGHYQKFKIDKDTSLFLQGFPDDDIQPLGVGSIRLELYGDNREHVVTLQSQGSFDYKRSNWPASSPPGDTRSSPKFYVQSQNDPIIIEIWKYNNQAIYLNYVGQFVETGSGGVPQVPLSSLGDVAFQGGLVNGQVLKYNSTINKWVNDQDEVTIIDSIDQIGDVVIQLPLLNNQILKYNSLDDQWKNVDPDITDYKGEISETSGEITLTTSVTFFNTGSGPAPDSMLLPISSTTGLVKTLAMAIDGGADMVVTVFNPGWKITGNGFITFSSIGQSCILQVINDRWFCIGNNGATFS